MNTPSIILVVGVGVVCGITAISFFRRAFQVNAVNVKVKSKVIIKAVQFRYNLIMGVIMAFFALSSLFWIIKNM